MAAFLANVGVNASHRARSPLHADGSFLLLPIPEAGPWREPMLRMRDIPAVDRAVPPAWSDLPAHLDPDLNAGVPTYGDNCATAPRAFNLRQAGAGDLVLFLARLHGHGGAAFHLVGRLVVEDILTDVRRDPGPGWWDGNAHVRRARAGHGWNGFWVFRGSRGSGLLPRAVRFARAEAEAAFGRGWEWRTSRSELQTIGSHTRSVRRLTGDSEARLRELAGA